MAMPQWVGGRSTPPEPEVPAGTPVWARVLVAVSAFLLLSMGGAIVAAPLTLPLLYLAVRGRRLAAGLRLTAVIVAALTVAEVVWAATYLTVDEAQPWIWLLPVAAGVAAAGAITRTAPATPVLSA